jgi:peptidoglycan hydrolase-like protein with peptidoglycan-binding domain
MSNPIMPGARSGAVAHVHRRLRVLGIDVPATELREDRFGPGTEAAIRRLQAELGLPVTGAAPARPYRFRPRLPVTPHGCASRSGACTVALPDSPRSPR